MRASAALGLVVLLCLVNGTGGPSAATRQVRLEAAPASLIDGVVIERDAKPDDRHTYQVPLGEGDFLDLSVTQDRLSLRLTATAPDGSVVRRGKIPNVDPMPERLLLVARTTGTYTIEVAIEPTGQQSMPSRAVRTMDGYSLRVEALRAATEHDRARDRLFSRLEEAGRQIDAARSLDAIRALIPALTDIANGWRDLGDADMEAITVMALGHVTSYFTPFSRDSATAYERAIPLLQQLGQPGWELDTQRRLGVEHEDAGRLEAAHQAYSSALALARRLQDRDTEGRILYSLSSNRLDWGHYDEARAMALRALDGATAAHDRRLEARASWVLGQLDELGGDVDAAFARYEHGLDLQSDGEIIGLLHLWRGFLHLRRGELNAARADFDARLAQGRTTVVQGDRDAHARIGLGDVLAAEGHRDLARATYTEARAAMRSGVPWLLCLAEQRLGRLALEDGAVDEARGRFSEMVAIAARTGHRQCEAEGRAGLADTAMRAGDLDTAETEAARVIDLVETFREAVVSIEARSSGFGALAPAYERAVEIGVRRAEAENTGHAGHGGAAARRALEHSERARARGLLDRVTEARAERRSTAPSTLIAERRQVHDEWRGTLAELEALPRDADRQFRADALTSQASALAARVREIDARIDVADPRRAAFTRSRTLDSQAIQALLDQDTLLLEFALGDARSTLWAVSASDVRMFALPPRAEMESLARRVHEGLSTKPGDRAALNAGEADRRALARMVLGPAQAMLGVKRLVIVPQGALTLVPFAALPALPALSELEGRRVEGSEPDDSRVEGPALVHRFEIVQAPSATILGALRAMPRPASASRTAFIFADPLFDAQDPRVRARTRSTPPSLTRAGRPLARLPFSRREADAIAALLPDRVTLLTGAAAARERVLDSTLADARFVHFATHGIVNDAQQNRSSVVLSQVDAQGRAKDGLLMLPDIYDLTLSADLVVLSGCHTALGPDVRGEGTLGLARAFLFAGARRVVASLWQVNDLATAELMTRFYRAMIVDGLAPAAALRTAQLQLAAIPRWSSPYFWAPFTLQGDWKN